MSIPEGWKAKPLSDVVSIQRGFDLPASERRPGPFPVLTSGETGGNHDVGPIPGPGVTIGRATNLGKPRWSSAAFWPHNTVMFVSDFKGNSPRWIYHMFEYTDLSGYDSGSVQPMLNRNYIAGVPVVVPPLSQQRAIAEVLGALDDKIAANRSVMASTSLLELALYDQMVLHADEFALLGTFASVTKGISYRSADLEASSTAMVSLKSVDRYGSYSAGGLKPYAGAFKQAQVIAPGEIVVAQTDLTQGAEVVGRAVRVPAARGFDTLVASLDLAIVRPSGTVTQEFLLGTLRSAEFREHCRTRTSGTTVLHLASGSIESFLAPWPSLGEQNAFAERSRPLIELGDSLGVEIGLLANLRDTLLPELMSGRMRVKDAEQQVEEVV